MQDITGLLKQHRIDRTLTAPPLCSNPESSLTVTFSLLFGLPRAMSRALVQLVKHDHATRELLHVALSGSEPASKSNIVEVSVYCMRKRLKPHGVEIITLCKQGYRLTPDSRDKIRKILAAYGADIVAAATPTGNPGLKTQNPRLRKTTR